MRRRLPVIFAVLLAAVLCAVVAVEVGLARRLYRDLPGPPLPKMAPIAGLGSLSATGCAACHAEIASEWRASAHGRAHTDPLYQAERRHEGDFYLCAYCHTPLVEQRAQIVSGLWWIWPWQVPLGRRHAGYQPQLEGEGVTCLACHGRDGAIVGPLGTTTPAHATRREADFAGPRLCQTCHALDVHFGASLLRPVQDTLGEWAAYRAAGGERICADCHMPEVSRPLLPGGPVRKGRSHALRGPWDVDFLRTGILLREVALSRPDGQTAAARVVLENGAGHRLPTAEPRRRLEVVLRALDAQGAIVGEDRQVIVRELDPVRLREAPGRDTTLAPREVRTIALRARTSRPAARARIEVRFYLWDADDGVAREAGLDAAALTRLVHEREGAL